MSKNIIRHSNWFSIFVCSSCLAEMSDNTKMYSHGICPHCGYKSKTSPTICSTTTLVVRKIYYHKWYQLFNRKTLYESKSKHIGNSIEHLVEQIRKSQD